MKFPVKTRFFGVAFLLLQTLLHGQKTLVLQIERPNKVKEKIFYLHDPITLKLKTKKRSSGSIAAIGDSAILLKRGRHIDTLLLRDVRSVIYNRSNHLTRAFSSAFAVAGLVLIGVDVTNNLINEESPVFKPRVLIVGASLLATGGLIELYERKRVRISKRKHLKVIELSPYQH